ncbi:MAG: threonylcarbamoyl-AMP synthase [Anaerolineae bacterium]|nr:threonylcarbamoyl-AMP synthase [Anaerolineae bacterium]
MMLTTRVLPSTDEKTLEEAAGILRAGGLVVIPTDTVYGVAGNAYLPEAVERIYHVKERPKDKAIPLLLADSEQVQDVASDIPPEACRLMEAFWPGGLTIILPKRPRLPDVVTAGGATVALRMPDHPFVLALIRALGAPLAVTSANVSGHPPATTANEAVDELRGRVALIVDGGMCSGGVPSTVLDLTVSPPRVLREGAVSLGEIWRVLG